MKTALVTIIRNEAKDILAWLAWHIRLGIDSFIIFDDDSSDGTLEILRAASAQYDIRLFTIKETHVPHTDRQRMVYVDALYALRDHFDWVGFLDSDEYLSLYRHNSIKEFLDKFDISVGAVGIHWCLYGSNGHFTRPDMPTPHAFTRHNLQEHAINRHVKTFLRPQAWNEQWVNPHYFPLIESKHYVSPEGRRHYWSKILGITHIDAIWDTARIMHFQNRSLEHYLERTRRYHENGLNLNLTDFHAHDFNENHDPRPQTYTKDILAIMRNIIFQVAAEAIEELPESTQPLKENQEETKITISNLIPWNNTHLEIHSSWIIPHEKPQNGIPLLVMQISGLENYAFLFALNENHHLLNFSIMEDSRLTNYLAYEIHHLETEENHIALRKFGGLSKTKSYLTITNQNSPLTADREKPDLWESFRLKERHAPIEELEWHEIPLIKFLKYALARPMTLSRLKQLPNYDRKLTLHCLPLFALLLDEAERKTLLAHLGPISAYIV